MRPERPNPYGIRTVNPTTWPQYPYNEVPRTPERSVPRYTIKNDWDQTFTLRDGVRLMLDVYRPQMPGERFPALVSFSPYTRQLQRENNPYGQNEAGISDFWVPHGYAHVIVDVRGSNESEGTWARYTEDEQRDFGEVVEWVARQPWCNGRVGMTGCSYFSVSQNLTAAQQPRGLAAIFPYDALTDNYRDSTYSGGIPYDGFARHWFGNMTSLNSASGRNPNFSKMQEYFRTVLGMKYPLDGPYYWERSTWTKFDRIQTPSYYGCHWTFYNLHLRGAFHAYMDSAAPVKRMLIGPTPMPVRPFAAYHQETLRWYDHWLKGLDSGVLEGDPIHLWIEGDPPEAGCWRDEKEWPLARTQWTEFHLGGSDGNGTLTDTPPLDGEQTRDYSPANERYVFGEPRWTYRGEPLDRPVEVTGPIQLNLVMASSAEDTDWIAILQDEAPDGSVKELTRGWLRSSHRAVVPERSRRNQPWHPHDRIDPLTPGKPEELQIEIIPTCNVFKQGHRIRLELANCDSLVENNNAYRRTLFIPARNTVLQGRGKSRIVLPVVPR